MVTTNGIEDVRSIDGSTAAGGDAGCAAGDAAGRSAGGSAGAFDGALAPVGVNVAVVVDGRLEMAQAVTTGAASMSASAEQAEA
jgi:hypothetical protein